MIDSSLLRERQFPIKIRKNNNINIFIMSGKIRTSIWVNICSGEGAGGLLTHRCVMCSGAAPGPWRWRNSCCTAGRGTRWGSGGAPCRSPPPRSPAPAAARCSSTSGGPAGSSHSGTISRTPCRGKYPLRGRKHKMGERARLVQRDDFSLDWL